MSTGASRIFVEQVREANAIVQSQASSGASQIFVEKYVNALAILRQDADPGDASRIFVERVREAATILGINISLFEATLTSLDLNGVEDVPAFFVRPLEMQVASYEGPQPCLVAIRYISCQTTDVLMCLAERFSSPW